MSDADRIAQLTAELAEARKRAVEAEMRHREGCPMHLGRHGRECTCGVILLNLERTAHERTKAERDEALQNARADLQVTKIIAAARDKAEAEAAESRRLLQKATADFESESRIYCAELAMMNPVVELARKLSAQNKQKLQHGRASQIEIELEKAAGRVNGAAGRDLTARVTLWRELERSVEDALGDMPEDHPLRAAWKKLAALDEKGTTDG